MRLQCGIKREWAVGGRLRLQCGAKREGATAPAGWCKKRGGHCACSVVQAKKKGGVSGQSCKELSAAGGCSPVMKLVTSRSTTLWLARAMACCSGGSAAADADAGGLWLFFGRSKGAGLGLGSSVLPSAGGARMRVIDLVGTEPAAAWMTLRAARPGIAGVLRRC